MISEALVRSLRRDPKSQRLLARLTPREREVLGHLAQGLTLKEIGAAMSLTYNAVASYTKIIYRKLEVQSAREAIRLLTDADGGVQ